MEMPSNIRLSGITPSGAALLLRTDSPGVIDIGEFPVLALAVHLGASSRSFCTRGGQSHYGTAVHGDINIVPPHTSSRWEIMEEDSALVVVVPQPVLAAAAKALDADPARVHIRNVFCLRDPQIETVCWALKSELESGCASGRLYTDSLVTAITARVLSRYSSIARPGQDHEKRPVRGFGGLELRRLLDYIEANLAVNRSLADIASFAGYSTSYLNTAFRQSTGMAIHEYVVRRRLERARTLLATSTQSITRIALDCGFAHQSHMARHMKRVLGLLPGEVRRNAKALRINGD
jgi:AraC family transcriptional regulator